MESIIDAYDVDPLELVLANPHKRFIVDEETGLLTFEALTVGEELEIPELDDSLVLSRDPNGPPCCAECAGTMGDAQADQYKLDPSKLRDIFSGDEKKKSREQQTADAKYLFVTAVSTIGGPEFIPLAVQMFDGLILAGETLQSFFHVIHADATSGPGWCGDGDNRQYWPKDVSSPYWIHYPMFDGRGGVDRGGGNYSPDLREYPAYQAIPTGHGDPIFADWIAPKIPDAKPGSFEEYWYPVYARNEELGANCGTSKVPADKLLAAMVGAWNSVHAGPAEVVPPPKGWGLDALMVARDFPVSINRGPLIPKKPAPAKPIVQASMPAAAKVAIGVGVAGAAGAGLWAAFGKPFTMHALKAWLSHGSGGRDQKR